MLRGRSRRKPQDMLHLPLQGQAICLGARVVSSKASGMNKTSPKEQENGAVKDKIQLLE